MWLKSFNKGMRWVQRDKDNVLGHFLIATAMLLSLFVYFDFGRRREEIIAFSVYYRLFYVGDSVVGVETLYVNF